jgi:hypothetical protein
MPAAPCFRADAGMRAADRRPNGRLATILAAGKRMPIGEKKQ